jgi:hypothetical protein
MNYLELIHYIITALTAITIAYLGYLQTKNPKASKMDKLDTSLIDIQEEVNNLIIEVAIIKNNRINDFRLLEKIDTTLDQIRDKE